MIEMTGEKIGGGVKTLAALLAVLAVIVIVSGAGGKAEVVEEPAGAYIVQATDLDGARSAIASVGGTVTHELGIINAAGAQLSEAQAKQVAAVSGVEHVYKDQPVAVDGFNDTYVVAVRVAADAWLQKNSADEVSGTVQELFVRQGEEGAKSRSVFQFDLSAIPVNAVITSATAHFWVTDPSWARVDLHRVTASWTEDNATWNSVGQSYDSVAAASFTPSHSGQFISVELQTLVQSWVDGTYINDGLMLIDSNNDDGSKSGYASREWPTAAQQPHLELEYILPAADDAPRAAGAAPLHSEGKTGDGVTVAVVDTGWYDNALLNEDGENQDGDDQDGKSSTMRLLAQYNAITDKQNNLRRGPKNDDTHGHGSHVTSAIANNFNYNGERFSVAPGADLVTVKAFDDQGRGSYLDVIRALDWILAKKDAYNIRVVNLSFSAAPQSYYWEDPLNQAVMRLWQAGVVVVAAAGNQGPDPMTIGVPGNVPYVITVGAMSDNFTPNDPNDDFLTSFSSAGPTVEAFVKPEVVAPGGHVVGLMSASTTLGSMFPEYFVDSDYFAMSGTSQATGIVSGIAAQMLAQNPNLTPDDVKCRLMATARPAQNEDGTLAYSVFQQGAGLVDAYAAVYRNESGCANQGLDIAADLDGTQHFQGPANQDANGNYYITDLNGDGYFWSGTYSSTDGYFWSGGDFWSGGFAWSDGYFWSGSFAWSDGYFWSGSYAWSSAETAVNNWVPQE